jgi:enterobacterial common antigen flippase
MKALLRSVFLIGLSTVATTAVSVVRNKMLAVVLGPAGVGLFAQMFGLQTMAAGIMPLGMQTGALRFIALYRVSDPKRLTSFVATSARMFLWLSLAATALCFVGIGPISVWATGNPAYRVMMIAPILGIPFLVQQTTWLQFVQAGLDVRSYSRALMITSVAGLAVLAPLVLIWGLKGASVHLFVFAVLGYLVARWTADRAMGPAMRREIDQAPFDRKAVGMLWRFGAANFVPFVLTLAFPFVLRAQIVQDCGLTRNGIYQALFAISMQYLAIPLNAMTAYSFPRISQLKELADINLEVNNATRVSVLFSAAGILAILLSRDLVIHLLFSDRFLGALALFPVQLVGDLIKSVSFAIQLPLLPQERHRARNIMAVIHYGVFAAIFFGVPREQRLWGAVWGHTLSWGVHLVMHLVYLHRTNGFRFTGENLRLLASSFVAVVAVAAMPFPDWRWRLAGVAVALVWAITSISRREVQQVVEAVRARLRTAEVPAPEGQDV